MTILQGSSTIAGLLGQPAKKFPFTQGQGSSEFQLYITGISGHDSDGVVIRTAHPYAVKNVVIRSTELGDMKNIVLYDVPGFDSPTELHKTQTEQMLKDADAIILVTNVGDRPNITGTQLDMLRKVRDEDKIKLSEKTFIFGNKIDVLNSLEDAKGNASVLRNDAKRYQISREDRVISGSAKAYLDGKSKLSEWGMPDGVDELRARMQEYYDNDRFEVLRRRAEAAITETVEFLRTLLAKYTPDVLDRMETGGKFMLALSRKAGEFVGEANAISRRESETILSTHPFSTQLSGNLEAIYPATDSQKDIIDNVLRGVSADPDNVEQLTEINSKVRNAFRVMFMKNLKREAAAVVENKQAEIRAELVRTFLRIMGMKQGSPYEKDLTKSVNALFDSYLVAGEEKCRFNTLVERFASGLINTLIRAPFASNERLERVRRTLPELFSLAVYYSMPENSGAFEVRDSSEDREKFFARILAHEDEGEPKHDGFTSPAELFAVKSVLIDWFDRNSAKTGLSVNELPIEKWAALFIMKGRKLDEMPKELAHSLEGKFYKAGWGNLDKKERKASLSQAVSEYLDGGEKKSQLSLNEMLSEFHAQASRVTARTLDDVMRLLDEDIMILRDLTAKAVIRATGLERAFVAVITNNITLICEGIMDAEGDGNKFDEWINLNVRKVLDSEFAAIDRDNMNSQTRKSIVAAIRQVLGSME